jgi:glycosyltransferase involved in cell wall biosynthesis
MKLSVIVPCLNGAATIATQLEALANQHWCGTWEVIISDNGSTDGSLAIAERYRQRLPAFQIVDSSDRYGRPHAVNIGAIAATGDALLFCDVDDEVAPEWLAAMGEALSEHDFVSCRIDGERLNPPWLRESRGNPQRNGLQPHKYPPYLSHAGGGTLGVKRSLHEAIGGYDEAFRFLADTDYCWRIQLSGTRLHFVPNAVVNVRYRDTLYGIYRQARGWGEYNVLLYKKYRPLGMPKLSWKQSLVGWHGLLRRLPQICHKGSRASWVRGFGWRVGRIRGCIKFRVVAF